MLRRSSTRASAADASIAGSARTHAGLPLHVVHDPGARRRDRDAGERSHVPGIGRPRFVGGARRIDEEPRQRPRRTAQERGGFVPEQRRGVGPLARSRRERHALIDERIPLVGRRDVEVALREEPVPSRRHVRPSIPWVPVEVLADEGGLVARSVEPRRERRGLIEIRAVAVALDPGVAGVATRQDRGPRRTAQRHVEEGVREPHPVIGRIREARLQPRHRRRPLRDGQRVPRLVVGDHEQHVRRALDRRPVPPQEGAPPPHRRRAPPRALRPMRARSPRRARPGSCHRSSHPPSRPCESATTPAAIESAIDSGSRPPRSRPSGERTRAISSSATPIVRSASTW